jgi:hypothetical protein
MAHLTANIGLRTGVVFDLINLDSEAAVDRSGSRQRRSRAHPGAGRGNREKFHYLVLSTGLGNRTGVLPSVDFRGQGGTS